MNKSLRKALLISAIFCLAAQPAQAYWLKVTGIIACCFTAGGLVAHWLTDDYRSDKEKGDNFFAGALLGAAAGGFCSLFVEYTDEEDLAQARSWHTDAQTAYNSAEQNYLDALRRPGQLDALHKIINASGGNYRYLQYATRLRTTISSLKNHQQKLKQKLSTLESRRTRLEAKAIMEQQDRVYAKTFESLRREIVELDVHYNHLIGALNGVVLTTESLVEHRLDKAQKERDDARQQLREEQSKPRVVIHHTIHHNPPPPPLPPRRHNHKRLRDVPAEMLRPTRPLHDHDRHNHRR